MGDEGTVRGVAGHSFRKAASKSCIFRKPRCYAQEARGSFTIARRLYTVL
jgi:hypothetical protein